MTTTSVQPASAQKKIEMPLCSLSVPRKCWLSLKEHQEELELSTHFFGKNYTYLRKINQKIQTIQFYKKNFFTDMSEIAHNCIKMNHFVNEPFLD